MYSEAKPSDISEAKPGWATMVPEQELSGKS